MTTAMASPIALPPNCSLDGEAPTPAQIAAIARPIARHFGITELYLFGSMARSEATDESDIDFIYATTDDDMRARRVANFREALREAFERDIDLVNASYLTHPERRQYDELIRSLFVRDVAANPILRILPTGNADRPERS